MKFILHIYDQSVMMHVKFHEDVIGCSFPGHVAKSVMCLVTDASLTADPGVAS